MATEADMSSWTDLLHSSSNLAEQAAPSAQFPLLQRNLDQLEALWKKLKSKTLRTEAPSQSIAATRLLARQWLNAEQLARDLKSFELKTTFEDIFPAEATSVDEYLQQVHEMAMVSAVQEAQKDNVKSFNNYMRTVLELINNLRMEFEDCASSSSSGGTSDSGIFVEDTNEEELCDYYGEPSKLQSRKEMSTAYWKDELGMTEIVSYKGRLWRSTGIVRDGKIYYSIEETLYMAEVGALHLLRDDLCLPLEEIYKMVSQGNFGCCWEFFEVYRHLKSLGYIIRRHSVPWTLARFTKNESKLLEVTEQINVESDREYDEGSAAIKMFKGMHIDEVKPVFDVYPPNCNFKKSSPGNPSCVLCFTSLPPSKQVISKLEKQCNGILMKFCNIEHGRISFFSFNTVELPLLP